MTNMFFEIGYIVHLTNELFFYTFILRGLWISAKILGHVHHSLIFPKICYETSSY